MSASASATAAQSKPTIKSVKVNSKLEENVAEYIPFSAEILAKHPSATLTAALNVLNCFTADMFLILVHIIAEKYGHNVDDVIATIKYDERWEQARSHPLVKSMTYFNQEDIDKEMGTIPISRKAKSDVSAEDLHDAEVAPKKAKAAASEAGETPAPVTAPKKSSKKKAAAAAEAETPATEVVEAAEAPAPVTIPKKSSKKKEAAAEVEAPTTEVEAVEAPAPATAPKKSSKKKEAVEAPAPATAPKKSSKKKEATEAPIAATEVEAPAPATVAKKSSKKKSAAVPAEAEAAPAPIPKVDEVVEELITNVSAMNLAAEAPPTKSKKVVNKKPSASKSAAAE